MKRIKWRVKALRQLREMRDNNTKAIIYDAVDSLKKFPGCPNIRKLANRNDYQLAVGNRRVIFTANHKLIRIKEVLTKNERTYK